MEVDTVAHGTNSITVATMRKSVEEQGILLVLIEIRFSFLVAVSCTITSVKFVNAQIKSLHSIPT